jgi:hypothetical protein
MNNRLLVFVDKGVEYMKVCLDVTLYWLGPTLKYRDDILDFYKQALALIQKDIKYYEREDMEQGAQRIDAQALHMLPDWLAGSIPTEGIFSLDLESGSAPNLPSDRALHFWSIEEDDKPAGLIRLNLPADFIKESPKRLLDLVLSLAKNFRFHSGHAGYSVNWDYRGEYAHDSRIKMGVLAGRFPAIDLVEAPATLMAIPEGFKRINWVTLLGNDLLAEKDIEASSWKGLEAHVLPHGMAFVAGDQPKVGDVNRKEDLSAYHKVGRALAPARSRDHIAFVADSDGDPDDERTERWLAYFDK